jgi:uncharacterized membrane protein
MTENLELHKGEQVSLTDYQLSYESMGSDVYFEVSRDTGESQLILKQIPNDEILEMHNETLDISEELDIKVVDVRSDSEGLYIDLELSSPQDIFADAELDSSAPRKVFVGQGGEVTVPMSLENTGIVNQTFSLEAQHNSSMDISFSYREFNVTELELASGEEASISAKFDVPQTARTGVYDVEMIAEGRSKATESIKVDIRQSSERRREKSISVDAEESFIGIKPGASEQVPVRVRNGGNVMLDNIEVSVEAPEGWETELSRNEVPGLEEYESFRTIVTVEAPANAEAGDHFLEISASSDDTSTDQASRVRMTIQQESNLRYIGLGLMVLSLGGLVYVYRKLGRR